MVGGLAADLLGRHVANGAQNLAGAGFRRGNAVNGVVEGLRPAQLGQAEIENLELPTAGDENIFRL
jgi:hypothetical protein